MSSQSLECFGFDDINYFILTDWVNKHGVGTLLSHVVIYRGSIICYSDLLSEIGAHDHKEIIEFVNNALFTDNVNPIAFKMAGKFRCVSFLVNNCFEYFPCAFDVPFCIR